MSVLSPHPAPAWTMPTSRARRASETVAARKDRANPVAIHASFPRTEEIRPHGCCRQAPFLIRLHHVMNREQSYHRSTTLQAVTQGIISFEMIGSNANGLFVN